MRCWSPFVDSSSTTQNGRLGPERAGLHGAQRAIVRGVSPFTTLIARLRKRTTAESQSGMKTTLWSLARSSRQGLLHESGPRTRIEPATGL
jgi:hypothetical protein